MSKASVLRVQDIRANFQLIGECREFGDDAVLWWRHFLDRLAKRIGAGFALGGEIDGCLSGSRRDLGITDWGWENGFNRAGWFSMLKEFHQDPFYNPLMNGYIDRLPKGLGACLSRSDMLADRDWYSSRYFQLLHRTLGADAILSCFQAVPRVADTYAEVYLVRPLGEKDFPRRSNAIVADAMASVAPLLGNALARFADPSPMHLSARARQVLRCLLEGDSDKQIARRLKIAPFTVNQHIKGIYRHFGVNSRAQLLARWLRRNWGTRCSWDD